MSGYFLPGGMDLVWIYLLRRSTVLHTKMRGCTCRTRVPPTTAWAGRPRHRCSPRCNSQPRVEYEGWGVWLRLPRMDPAPGAGIKGQRAQEEQRVRGGCRRHLG